MMKLRTLATLSALLATTQVCAQVPSADLVKMSSIQVQQLEQLHAIHALLASQGAPREPKYCYFDSKAFSIGSKLNGQTCAPAVVSGEPSRWVGDSEATK